jgi:hypothetical protein
VEVQQEERKRKGGGKKGGRRGGDENANQEIDHDRQGKIDCAELYWQHT